MLFPATARGGRCISLLPSLKRAQEFEAGRGGVLRSSKRNEKRASRRNVKSQYVPKVPVSSVEPPFVLAADCGRMTRNSEVIPGDLIAQLLPNPGVDRLGQHCRVVHSAVDWWLERPVVRWTNCKSRHFP